MRAARDIVKNFFIAVILVAVSVLAFLAIVEFAARTGLLPLGSVPWYRVADVVADRDLDQANENFSNTHPFSFNAPIPGAVRAPGTERRIVILGDSFVWGSGLPIDDAWPHQLTKMMKASHPEVEIMSWGVRAWSTKDELGFLKMAAAGLDSFEADAIIVGFVTNDPNIDDIIPQKYLEFDSQTWRWLRGNFPNAYNYISAHYAAFYARWIDSSYGYGNWENALYSAENLARYETVLRELKAFCDEHRLPLVILLTPHLPNELYFHSKYAAVTALFDRVGIAYVNPLPTIVGTFVHASDGPLYPSLWANAANGHPGKALTEVYAHEALRYMENHGWLEGPIRPRTTSPTKPCQGGVKIRLERAVSYRYLGNSYLRLRGSVLEPSVGFTGGDLNVGESKFPLVVLSGSVALPSARQFAPNSFWVDVPASMAVTPGVMDFFGGNNCYETDPISLKPE